MQITRRWSVCVDAQASLHLFLFKNTEGRFSRVEAHFVCYITNWLYQVLSKQFVGMKLLCTNGLRASLKLLISKPCAKSLLSLTTYKWIWQCVALPQLSFFNPFILNRMSEFYQLDESISNLRVATGLSAVCDCGISCSYSLTIFVWWYLSFFIQIQNELL